MRLSRKSSELCFCISDFWMEQCLCLSCQQWYDNANHLPYILPCSFSADYDHNLCKMCVRNFLARNDGYKLTCPECGRQHKASAGVNSFHVDVCILSTVKTYKRNLRCRVLRQYGTEPEDLQFEHCRIHAKPVRYYCDGSRCGAAMCLSCLKAHCGRLKNQKHILVDIKKHMKIKIHDQAIRGISYIEKITQCPSRESDCWESP